MNATDPFNWPSLKRADLMSLSSINKDKDLMRVKTAQVSMRKRSTSMNLDTMDIEGKKVYKMLFSLKILYLSKQILIGYLLE